MNLGLGFSLGTIRAMGPRFALADPRLRWRPPAQTAPTILTINRTSNFSNTAHAWTNTSGNGRANGPRAFAADEDVILLPNASARADAATLQITGGRHVRMIGGEHKGRCLFLGQSGSDYVEGVKWTRGGASADCLAVDGQGYTPDVYMQNCLATGVNGTSGGEHADIFQQQGSLGRVYVDKLTGDSNYQGIFIKGSDVVSSVSLSRINLTFNGITPRTSGTYLIQVRALASEPAVTQPIFPVEIQGVYVDRYEGSTPEAPWPACFPDNALDCQGFVGSNGANTISVGGGANLVLAGGGDDTILGGVTYLAEEPLYRVRGEKLYGQAGDDTIASGGACWHYAYLSYYAGAGSVTDWLFGGRGDDHMIGGAGRVVMTGGSGADVFEARADVFTEHAFGTAALVGSTLKIRDFDPSEDVIHFRMGAVDDFADAGDPSLPIPDVGFEDLTILERGGDTIVTYAYDFHTYGIDDALPQTFRMVLKGFTGLTEADIAFI